MAQRNGIESFIYKLFKGSPNRRMSKREIAARAAPLGLAPELRYYIDALPDRDYDEDNLVIELNHIIEECESKTEVLGGVVRKPRR